MTNAPPDPIETLLSARLRDLLAGYHWISDVLGRSSASVFRLEADGRPPLYLKSEIVSPFSELDGEVERLHWLAAQGFLCPKLIAHEIGGGRGWLLMTALEGVDLASAAPLLPLDRVRMLAQALRTLHGIDIAACPFDHRLEVRIEAAKARVLAGLVDETDFDEARLGQSARTLFRELVERRPAGDDVVVTHGDACLPNFIAAGDRFAGYIDCGRLGVADRYQDIALACGSIGYNFGEALVPPFLEAYGISEVDVEKMDYYQLLDEFF
ncbi:APH(3') family aminoglycoside O-phosphotransferase [Rhizobium sp. BK602]|uniref:APH(3') family aminoglycoside O-phosphotransferase n=1 Tax=Rhizobium sp. BK602 TaxID=2586986 RepID=UPI001611A8B6|nr:APH(3') family aminoglycoside O-phosphotransferase [Rhizobium sp. BK602]